MALRQEIEAQIAELQRKIEFWRNAIDTCDPRIDNLHLVCEEHLAKIRIDLAVARDSLQLLNEEQCDIDRDFYGISSNPIVNQVRAKGRY